MTASTAQVFVRRFASILLVMSCVLVPTSDAAAQDDPRLTQAVEHFRNGEFASAGELFDEVAGETPSNLLNLNAMAAWYKADRCEEAMAARSRVDRTERLEPQDVEDLDRVNAYCKLKSARAFKDEQEWDKALGLLAGLETQDQKLAGEIVALRQQIEADKQAAEDIAKSDKTGLPENVVEPPPEPDPRPRWALYAGVGLLAGGAALGTVALVKWRAIDQPNATKGWDQFNETWGCTEGSCEEQIPTDHPDRDELSTFQANLRTATAANVSLGVASGVAAASGAAFLAYYLMSETPPPVALVPILEPDTRGLALSLQF